MSSHRWKRFFVDSGLPSEISDNYAVIFTENRIRFDMLDELNKEILYDIGIKKIGDVIAILRHAKEVHSNSCREKVFAHGNDNIDDTNITKADSTISNESLKKPNSKTNTVTQFQRVVISNKMDNVAVANPIRKRPETKIIRQITAPTTVTINRKRIIAPEDEPTNKMFKGNNVTSSLVRNRIDSQNRLSRFSKEIQTAISSNATSSSSPVTTRTINTEELPIKARLSVNSGLAKRKIIINRTIGNKSDIKQRLGTSIKGKRTTINPKEKSKHFFYSQID